MKPRVHEGECPGRVAIIAGNGQLPVFVAEKLAAEGRDPYILAIEGEADPALRQYPNESIFPGHPGRLVAALKRVNPAEVTLIGGVRSRPSLWRIIPDWTTLRLAARMLPKLRSGDDSLLRGVVDMIEEAGFAVRGVHELVPDLLAEHGLIAGPKPSRMDQEALIAGVEGAFALGAIDAGQACVALGKRIVALEGAEGTDLMLQRVSELRRLKRLPSGRGGVLVKLAKAIQDKRVDLPAIGVSTIENAAAAGLRCVAVHAGNALVADFSETRETADRLQISLLGIDPEAVLKRHSIA